MRAYVASMVVLALAAAVGCSVALADLGSGPPAAFLQTATAKVRLAQSSYCWGVKGGGLCPHYAPPSCVGFAPAPHVKVQRGERVRLLLGFKPTSLTVQLSAPLGPTVRLPPRKTSWFRISRAGVLLLSAADARGNTSYAACIVLR
jgi:hypothetical protein